MLLEIIAFCGDIVCRGGEATFGLNWAGERGVLGVRGWLELSRLKGESVRNSGGGGLMAAGCITFFWTTPIVVC